MRINEVFDTTVDVEVVANTANEAKLSFDVGGVEYAVAAEASPSEPATWVVDFARIKNGQSSFDRTNVHTAFPVIAGVIQACKTLVSLHPDIQTLQFFVKSSDTAMKKVVGRIITDSSWASGWQSTTYPATPWTIFVLTKSI